MTRRDARKDAAAAVAARLARGAPLPAGLRMRRVVNDGAVERAVAEVVRALLDGAGEARGR